MSAYQLLELLGQVGRVHAGHENYLAGLRHFAQELIAKAKPGLQEPVLLSGWERSEEGFEGDSTEGSREVLGQGIKIFSVNVDNNRQDNNYDSFPHRTSDTYFTLIEAWKWQVAGQEKVLFLVMKVHEYSGVVGMDNRPGSDTTWQVTNIRIIDI